MDTRKTLIALLGIAAAIGAQAASEVTVAKPYLRWLWGGFGWQHCEATLASHMSDEFRDERQIASTVATSCRVTDEKAAYSVVSVDRWGNVGQEVK